MKKSARIGIDGANLILKLADVDVNTYMEEQQIKNFYGELLAKMEIKRGILYLYVNFPKMVRKDNTWPLSSPDFFKLKDMRDLFICNLQSILEEQWIFCDVSKSTLKKIECGCTQQVTKGCTCSWFINLLNISYHMKTNHLHQSAMEKYRYCKINESVCLEFEDKKVKYKLKGYDKTLEQHNNGNDEVENNLLRIEIVFLQAAINKLFGGEVTLYDLFQQKNLMKIVREYKRLFVEVVIKKYINTCLEDTTNKVFETLTQVGSPVETVAMCNQFITDEKVLREALRKWNKFRGMTEVQARRNADKTKCDCKKYELPKGVIKTIREFEKSCR